MRTMITLACTAALLTVAAPVAGQPPEESGVVTRIHDDGDAFGILLDEENGYWVFGNISREDFCAWFDDEAPFPGNEDPDDVMLVSSSDAEHLLVRGGGPTALHAWAGDGPGQDPCSGSQEEPALTGDVRVRVVDNDLPNQGTRANTFSEHGVGRLVDGDGNTYHYSWRFHALWNPDGSEFRILQEDFRLTRTG